MGDNKVKRERGSAEGGNKQEIEVWTRVLFTYSPIICALYTGQGASTAVSLEPHTLHV